MMVTNKELLIKPMGTPVWVTGLLLMALGLLGIFFPNVISLTIGAFLALLMITGGVLYGYYVYHLHIKSFAARLKSAVLILGGSLLLFFPIIGISAIALLLAFYLFTDAFGSFGMAYERHPFPGWLLMVFNGVVSLILAMLILVGWPATSAFFLGIFLGISLFVDGTVLVLFGLVLNKL